MTAQHTPGPWHCKQSANRTHPFSIMGGGFNLAQVENIDDACLIALAPTMLATLQTIAEWDITFSGLRPELRTMLDAVISLATETRP